MVITKQNVFRCLDGLESKIEAVISKKADSFDYSKCRDIIQEYNEISGIIASLDNLPEDTARFLTSGEADVKLPEKYEKLKCIDKLYSYINTVYDAKIKEALKKKNQALAIDSIVSAMKLDAKNIELFNNIAAFYTEQNLQKELIEIYKLMFIYSLNPLYFEKIGDTYMELKEYNSALVSYLTCAESSEESAEIYKKLADVFGKINDNDSRLACLEQIKKLHNDLNEVFSSVVQFLKKTGSAKIAEQITYDEYGHLPEDFNSLKIIDSYKKILSLKYTNVETDNIEDKIYMNKLSVELNPPEEIAYLNIARALYENGNYAESLELCKFIKTISDTAPVWCLLGDIYRSLKMYGESIDSYRTYLELNENDEEAEQTLSEIYEEALS